MPPAIFAGGFSQWRSFLLRCVISSPTAALKLRYELSVRFPFHFASYSATAMGTQNQPEECYLMESSKTTTHEARHPDPTAEAKPEYHAQSTPTADPPRECHPVKPPAAPSSAAENHEDANQKCNVPTDSVQPQTASKDQREKATG
jgi:hypothetical protein